MVYFCRYLRQMQVDVLIVGQGICGTLLSWFLHKQGKSFLVIDDANENSASNVAAGVINPVTGRRYVTSWMADEVMAFAELTYKEIGDRLNIPLFYRKNIIDFFPTAQMRNTFVERITEDDTYLHTFPDQNLFNPFFHYEFGCGEIRPAFVVHLQALLTEWRLKLQELGFLQQETFFTSELEVHEDAILYNGITAQKVIFCDGIAGTNSSWFNLLPFSANKGEALFIQAEGLNKDAIYKRGMLLVPLPEENMFWLGSNYQWEYEDDAPSEKFYTASTELLRQWLKVPFKVVAHKAAIRPATLERRPFVGFHPKFPSVGILNGMGTKGTSLAPFFANQLVQHLVFGLPITPEADVQRFSRILSK